MPTRPPRMLKSVGLDVIPAEPGEETLGVLTVDSDRGAVEYMLTAEGARAFQTTMNEFLDYGNSALDGKRPEPKEGEMRTVPISPTSITVGETEIEGEKYGVLQMKSEDGREANLYLTEGQAEFVIQAATQLQALLNKTRQ